MRPPDIPSDAWGLSMDRSDMAEPEQSSVVLSLDARYGQVLEQLEQLNRQVEAVLNSVRPASPPVAPTAGNRKASAA